MERSIGTIAAIKALGYPHCACVRECGCDELPCPLLTWLVAELRSICPELKDRVAKVVLGEELRELLANLFSPLTAQLTSEVLGPALLNTVTEFLVSELQAAHILHYKNLHPSDAATEEELEREQRVDDYNPELTELLQEDCGEGKVVDQSLEEEAQAELTGLMEALGSSSLSQFEDVSAEVESRIALLPGGEMVEPLLTTNLNSKQWCQLEKLNQAMLKDYQCRRQMMIKRFQVTLQSFAWGEKSKEHSEVVAKVPPLASFSLPSQVSLSLLLAAREDQSCIMPVKAGPSTAIHKVQMGSVPDRGGRPGELDPIMPVWGNRRERGGGGGRPRQQHKFSGEKKRGKKD